MSQDTNVGEAVFVVTASTRNGANDASLVKYTSEGKLLWARDLDIAGLHDDWGTAVAVGRGAAFVLGHTTARLNGEAMGSSDVFLARYICERLASLMPQCARPPLLDPPPHL